MVLTVGIFDSDLPYMRQAVYALVHGSKSNLVGLFLIKQDLSVYWVAHSRLHKVEFEEPLCDVGDHAMSQHKSLQQNSSRSTSLFLRSWAFKGVWPLQRFLAGFHEFVHVDCE